MKNYIQILLLLFILLACDTNNNDQMDSFEVYCEMVANAAKPIALSQPMGAAAVDASWENMEAIARQYSVQLYREDNFPVSLLFPAALTTDKSVILIYKGNSLQQYQMWKADAKSNTNNNFDQQEALARRFGRLLGYTPQGINELLKKNSAYNNLAHFGVEQQLTHLYYTDLEEAQTFYEKVLGLNSVGNNKFQISEDALIELHLTDASHPEGQPKSTAIALLTNQLPAWYQYVKEQGIPVKYTYKPREGGPHDGFVAIDPGGYLLEFEEFKQHPENERFMPLLANAPRIKTNIDTLNFYGSITWTYHRDLLKMQQFYEEALGYELVADQGWTKIYQCSATGFIGLVDECRGMENYADSKAIEIEWILQKSSKFNTFATNSWQAYNYSDRTFTGPEQYVYRVQ